MPIPPAQKAIANLIDSAERGEIDPWDVPVIQVIDRFLTELGLTGTAPPPTQEADLPQSGQAFLWASMLVLLKADTLEILQAVEEVEGENTDEMLWDEIETRN
nr:segregation/condensation protein A [Xenococcaceae cyanobacterium MO_188.B19]